MGRGLWFAAGAGTAVYATIKARRLAYRLSAGGVADQVAALRLGVRALGDDIATGTREREAELVEELGLGRPRAAGHEDPGPPVRLVTAIPHEARKDLA